MKTTINRTFHLHRTGDLTCTYQEDLIKSKSPFADSVTKYNIQAPVMIGNLSISKKALMSMLDEEEMPEKFNMTITIETDE